MDEILEELKECRRRLILEELKECKKRLEITTNALIEMCGNDLGKFAELLKKHYELLKKVK